MLIKRDRQPGTGPDWRINYVTAYSNTCTGRAQVCGICLFVAYNTTRFGPAGPSFFRVPPLAVAPANAPCPVPKRGETVSRHAGVRTYGPRSRRQSPACKYILHSRVHRARCRKTIFLATQRSSRTVCERTPAVGKAWTGETVYRVTAGVISANGHIMLRIPVPVRSQMSSSIERG